MHIFIGTSIAKRQRGDTLVEVLIAIAVISLILAGAYVTTNRSLYATRSAQERSNALKLAESQIEQLKGLAGSNPTALFGGAVPNPFCISNTGTVVPAANPACSVGTTGVPTTVEPIFRLSIARSGNTFTLTETWIDVGGKQTDSLQLKYRVYQ
jgi:prepilin-type N-terminal cleavage/methylation domain-containing protein